MPYTYRLSSRVAIDPEHHLKLQILASAGVRFMGFDQINLLIHHWIDQAWEDAKLAGLVNNDMLQEVSHG